MEHWKDKLKLRIPAIGLLIATLFFWSAYDRYEPDGPILLKVPSLDDAYRVSGEISEADSRFTLHVPEGGKRAEIRFRLSTATNYPSIRVRARVKTRDVVAGEYAWNSARFFFAQYDTNKKWMPGRHGLMGKSGSSPWKSYESVFEIFEGAAYADAVLQQGGISGTAEFESIEIQPVRVRASFVWWRIIFAGLWLSAACVYFPRCRLHRRKLKVLILLNALAILAGSIMPSCWIEDSSQWFAESAKQVLEKPVPARAGQPQTMPPTEKKDREISLMDQFNEVVGGTHRIGHFTLFASLCFLVYCSAALERQHRSYYFRVAFDILLFASITESLQHLTLDRTAGIYDWLTDVYGMLLALCIFSVLHGLYVACRRTRDN
jgi:hypothetical protein